MIFQRLLSITAKRTLTLGPRSNSTDLKFRGNVITRSRHIFNFSNLVWFIRVQSGAWVAGCQTPSQVPVKSLCLKTQFRDVAKTYRASKNNYAN